MKKLSYFLSMLLICSVTLFTACGDDGPEGPGGDDDSGIVDGGGDGDGDGSGDGDGDETPKPGDKPYDEYEYSELTIEEQKEKLQGDANALLAEFSDVKDNKTVAVLQAFAMFNPFNEDDEDEGGIGEEINNTGKEYYALRSDIDLIKMSDFYGIFKYDKKTGEWDVEESSSKLEFSGFPVTETQTGKIVITSKTSGVKIDSDIDEEWDDETGEYIDVVVEQVELPKEVTAKIYLGSSEVGKLEASSAIKDNKTIPTLSELNFKLDNYTIDAKATKSSPNVVTSTMKKGSKVLFEAKADLTGNMDKLAQENLFETGVMNGNILINIYNKLAITGELNVSAYLAIADKADNIWDDYYNWEDADEAYNKTMADGFNNCTELYLVSPSDETKIAKVQMRAKERTYTYGGYWISDERWNEETEEWEIYNRYIEKYTVTEYWDTVACFVFEDGTSIDAEVYFSSGFDKFINNLNKFIDSFLGEEE